MKLQSFGPPGQNLAGERDIEWSWVLSHLENGPGKALDLGPGMSLLLSITAAQKGYTVVALDRLKYTYSFVHPNIVLTQADILTCSLEPSSLDLIICCSFVEHVGLTGRYQTSGTVPNGDIVTFQKLNQAIQAGGHMLFTVPVGLDAVFAPYHRVYGENRLPMLLKGWRVLEECYWVKESNNQWSQVLRKQALVKPASKYHYGLGLFVLQKE
jgi:2-polyprenyl-3-methyl-5-hydroxy-6-metoxy-1,4-benzoquinol methylase